MRLLQTNLGRWRWVQDLFFQIIPESTVALAVVTEPYRVSDWVGDINCLIVMMWISTSGVPAPGVPRKSVNGYVALE